jgi:hypothetical protein
MGDSYIGVEHALLAMIRTRDTVPARALAGLADLDALEAAVLEAKNGAVPHLPPQASRSTSALPRQSARPPWTNRNDATS